jgi:hypothetical protein
LADRIARKMEEPLYEHEGLALEEEEEEELEYLAEVEHAGLARKPGLIRLFLAWLHALLVVPLVRWLETAVLGVWEELLTSSVRQAFQEAVRFINGATFWGAGEQISRCHDATRCQHETILTAASGLDASLSSPCRCLLMVPVLLPV